MNIKNRLTKIEQTITSQRENKAAEDTETQRQELIGASDFFANMAYDLSLINAGLIGLTLFPPTPENSG